MDSKLEEFRKERDLIVGEIGEFDEEDFIKSGISMEEFNNPNEKTISKLLTYVREEYNQIPVYGDKE